MFSSLKRIAITVPLCAMALLTGPGAAFAAPIDFPPLTDGATAAHLPGKVVWADLVTPNLAGAEAFYTGLFGWNIREIHVGDTDYGIASADGSSNQRASTPSGATAYAACGARTASIIGQSARCTRCPARGL